MIKRNFEWMTVWLIITIGALLPWITGFGIKIYRDSKGEPTWDWPYFLHPGRLIAEVWTTLWLAAPSIGLGLLAYLMFNDRISWVRLRPLKSWEQGMIVITSALWGAAGSVPVFIEMFWEFHPVSFLLPFFHTVLYLDDYMLGLVAGVLLALTSLGIRNFNEKARTR